MVTVIACSWQYITERQTENGLPVAEENPELWKIEDAFVELLNKVDAIDAGLMKWNNRVNFFFYAKVADVGDELVKGLKEQFPRL